VNEYQTASETKYASAESSAREWAEVTARANMHKGKWSEYWEEAKAAGDMGNEKVSLALSCVIQTQRLCYIRALMLYCHMVEFACIIQTENKCNSASIVSVSVCILRNVVCLCQCVCNLQSI